MITREQLEAALQDVWNDHCADTGCIPDAFAIHGPRTTRVVADFHRGSFVDRVLDILQPGVQP